MCGILAALSEEGSCGFGALKAELAKRGPDLQGEEQVAAPGFRLGLFAAVLALSGPQPARQPYCVRDPPSVDGREESILLWNGELFRRLGSGPESDTASVARRLHACGSSAEVLDVLDRFEGPHAAMFWSAHLRRLFITRDKMGRRSLGCAIIRERDSNRIVAFFSSLAAPADDLRQHDVLQDWFELPVEGAFSFGPSEESGIASHSFPTDSGVHAMFDLLRHLSPRHHSWLTPTPFGPQCSATFYPEIAKTRCSDMICRGASPDAENFEQCGIHGNSDDAAMFVSKLLESLTEAVRKRISVGGAAESRAAPVGILFSGGVDSAALAAVLMGILQVGFGAHCTGDPPREVELINVCFAGGTSPDRRAARFAYDELIAAFPSAAPAVKLLLVDVSEDELRSSQERIVQYLKPCTTHMDFNIGAALYFASRGEECRVVGTPPPSARDEALHPSAADARAGGPPWAAAPAASSDSPCDHCRRYRAARRCSLACCRSCCRAAQRQIARTAEPPVAFRCSAHSIEKCLRPLLEIAPEADAPDTLDFDCDSRRIRARSRVLLVGSGADELLGGYGRHLTAMRHGGTPNVRQVLLEDLNRLWVRNLGRDDRLVGSNGREARYPFLDEDVVRLIGSVPIETVLGHGCSCVGGRTKFTHLGDNKWALRALLRGLGLEKTSAASKRAMQFGTRSAKVTNHWHFSSNRAARGDAIYCTAP